MTVAMSSMAFVILIRTLSGGAIPAPTAPLPAGQVGAAPVDSCGRASACTISTGASASRTRAAAAARGPNGRPRPET